MANPQKENGYTPIANELLDVFARTKLSPYEWQIVFAVIRFSYGWQKKEATLTFRQIEQYCNIRSCDVSKVVKRLIKKQIIIKKDKQTYSLQKDYEKWGVAAEQLPQSKLPQSSCRRASKRVAVEQSENGNIDRKINNLHAPKEISKEIYLSLREKLLNEWKRQVKDDFPQDIPLNKIDFFLYKKSKGEIVNPIRNIRAYIKGMSLEPFPNIEEREKKKEAERQARRQEIIEREKEIEKIDYTMNLERVRALLRSLDKHCQA